MRFWRDSALWVGAPVGVPFIVARMRLDAADPKYCTSTMPTIGRSQNSTTGPLLLLFVQTPQCGGAGAGLAGVPPAFQAALPRARVLLRVLRRLLWLGLLPRCCWLCKFCRYITDISIGHQRIARTDCQKGLGLSTHHRPNETPSLHSVITN